MNPIPARVVAQSKTRIKIPKVTKNNPLMKNSGADTIRNIFANLSIWVMFFFIYQLFLLELNKYTTA